MTNKILLGILISFFFVSCTRDKIATFTPEENPFKVMPTYFKQNVLLETVVSESQEESYENATLISQLEEKYGDRLIVVNLHKQDWLETPYTNELANILGGINTYPTAAANRTPGSNTALNEDGYSFLSPINWEYAIDKAGLQQAKLALAVETGIHNNLGNITLHIAFKDSLHDDMRVGLYMCEDEVPAIFQQGADNDSFKHQRVMKESLIDVTGDKINLSDGSTLGEIIIKQYDNIDLKFYNKQNLYLVAYVFNYDKDFRKMKIYNSIKVKFGGTKFWNQ